MAKSIMKAILVAEYGGPEVLKLGEVERPQPQAGEVLVRVVFAAAIPLDWKIRKGYLQKVFAKAFTYIPGTAVSGIVESVGTGVSEFQAGNRVFGSVNGGYAEFGIAAVTGLVKIPDNLSFEDAASIGAGADSEIGRAHV